MPHFGGFGIQIAGVLRVAANDHRHQFANIDARLGQYLDLFGIIGQQTYCFDAQQFKHVGAEGEIPLVGGKAELMIGFDRIGAFVLQSVGANFVQQADISAFLAVVEQYAAPLFGDMTERRLQLEAAIAAQAEQGIAGKAFGMDTRQHRRRTGDITIDQRQMVVPGGDFLLLPAVACEQHQRKEAPRSESSGFYFAINLPYDGICCGQLATKCATNTPLAIV